MAKFTSQIMHVPGRLNIVADLMLRPPQVVPASGPATTASIKMPSGSLAVYQVVGGTAGASPILMTAVTATEIVELEQLVAAQSTCPSIAQLQNSSSLVIQSTPVGQHLLWCDTSSGRRQPLVPLPW